MIAQISGQFHFYQIKMKVNPKVIFQISELLDRHLSHYNNSLDLSERNFIYDNIDDYFLYHGDAYRLFLFENEYKVDKSVSENCSWSYSISGNKTYLENFNGDWEPELDSSQLWIADVFGIEVNSLVEYLNYEFNSNITTDFFNEEEILALKITDWELLDINCLKNKIKSV